MPIHDPWHHQARCALLSHQHHCPLNVSKTLKGTKAATFERQPHIGRHSCHHQDPLPCPSPTSLCPCLCQIMQGVTMLCALLLDVSCARAHCAHHSLVLCAVHIVHPSTLPLGWQKTNTAAEWSGTAQKHPQVPKSCLIASRAFLLATGFPHHSPSSPMIESEIFLELILGDLNGVQIVRLWK